MLHPHGIYRFEWENDIQFLYISGPFNEEGINALISETRDSILSKDFLSWKRAVIVDEEALSTPETFITIQDQGKWVKDHGCIATALVYKSALQADIFEELTKKSGMQHKAFTDLNEALSWLQEI